MKPKLNKDLIKQELLKRQNSTDYLGYCFEQQKEFITDPAPFKAAFTNRRAGKSTAIGVYIVKTAMEKPGCNILYLGLSKQTAMNTLWKDILNPILVHFNIAVQFSEKRITFPNGSVLFVQGTNANDRELGKVLGVKYFLAFLDEAQHYTIETENLIYQSLGPTVQDMGGTIVLAGTPTDNTKSFFYEVTKQTGDRLPGWSVHEWQSRNNIIKHEDGYSQAERYLQDVERLRTTTKNLEEIDWFQQQYLGQWVIQDTAKVYRYTNERNSLPDASVLLTLLTDNGWLFILGVDFGFTDASAFCVLAFNKKDPNIYIIESEKHVQWTITQVADRIKDLDKTYHFTYMVGDSAAKQSIAEIARHHQLPLKGVDKPGKKREAISIINADFISSRIKVDPINNEALIEEMSKLVWDAKKMKDGIYEEAKKFDNHICDAMLYAYRISRHYEAENGPRTFDPMNNQQDRYRLLDQKPETSLDIMDHESIFSEKSEEEILMDYEMTHKGVL